MTDDDLDLILRDARDDTAPLGAPLRRRILADAARQTAQQARPQRLRNWLGGLVGVPTAAALGLWLGIAQPTVVLNYVPGAVATSETDALLMDDVFGTVWTEGETG